MGPEGIVYGDKVMNNRNHRRSDVYPERFREASRFSGPAEFVANGEIGMAVGQLKRRGQKFKVTKLKVEFSTQLGVEYGFGGGDLPRDGGDTFLELAYARNRYIMRSTRTQHRPASRQVNDHGRVSAPTCVLKGSDDDDVEDRRHDPCCASDGGRSCGVAVQAEIPNHRRLRRSRAGVVSAAVDVSL